MRHGIEQSGSQFFTLPCCFDLRCQILCPRPLQPDGNQVTDSLQDRIRHLRALQRETGDGFRAQPHSGYCAIVLCVGERCALQGRVAKLIVQTFEIGWTGAVELFGAPLIEHHGVKLENVRKLPDKLLREWFGLVNQENRSAERVQPLHILLPRYASKARRLASVESRLATSDVVKKLNRATQFWGSAIVNLPTGGKKKKLKVSVAVIEASDASKKPQTVAMISTSSKYAKPAVVALTGRKL